MTLPASRTSVRELTATVQPHSGGAASSPGPLGRARWHSDGLDVLRAACFLGVWLAHNIGNLSTPALSTLHVSNPDTIRKVPAAGSFGVVGFFVLSSYLLTRLLMTERAHHGSFSVRHYWVRRILRIWPLYFLALGLAFTVYTTSAHFGATVPYSPMSLLPSFATFTANWVAPFHNVENVLGHLWSVCVEEQMYFFLPLLLLLRRRRRLALAAMLVLGPIARLWTAHAAPYPAVWNFTSSYLDVFAIGVIMALLDVRSTTGWERFRRRLTGRFGVFAAAVCAIAFCWIVAQDEAAAYGSEWTVLTYLGAACIAAWFLQIANTARVRSSLGRAMQWLGVRSYGLYVFHWPVLLLIVSLRPALGLSPTLQLLEFPVSFVATCGIAAFVYAFYERRFLRFRRRFQWVSSDASKPELGVPAFSGP